MKIFRQWYHTNLRYDIRPRQSRQSMEASVWLVKLCKSNKTAE